MPNSDKELQLMDTIRRSGSIDFDKLGQTISEVTPQLFDPDVAADDYIAKGYSSVVQVWKVGAALDGLEQVAQLQNIAQQVRQGPVQ